MRKKETFSDVIYRNYLKENLKKECYICGRKKDLELHHKIPLNCCGEDILDNIIYLCNKCHRNIHKIDNQNPTAKDYLKRLKILRKNKKNG